MPPYQSHLAPSDVSAHEKPGPPGQVFFRMLPALLTLAGIALLLYVSAEYAWMFIEQQRFSRELQTQSTSAQGGGAQQPKGSGGAFARLLTPKISLDAIVVEGTSRKALLVGPGHLTNTVAPGDAGNSVLAAHRDTFFRRLGELAPGDVITVDRGGRQYHYQVMNTEIVEPSATEVLQNSPGYRLTLITCYPFHYIGPAPKRFIVFAQLANSASESSVSNKSSGSRSKKLSSR